LSFPRLRRSACFRRLTGVSVATFDRMVAQCGATISVRTHDDQDEKVL
jgi:hypothetical protein